MYLKSDCERENQDYTDCVREQFAEDSISSVRLTN
jgi:hypothetical protein